MTENQRARPDDLRARTARARRRRRTTRRGRRRSRSIPRGRARRTSRSKGPLPQTSPDMLKTDPFDREDALQILVLAVVPSGRCAVVEVADATWRGAARSCRRSKATPDEQQPAARSAEVCPQCTDDDRWFVRSYRAVGTVDDHARMSRPAETRRRRSGLRRRGPPACPPRRLRGQDREPCCSNLGPGRPDCEGIATTGGTTRTSMLSATLRACGDEKWRRDATYKRDVVELLSSVPADYLRRRKVAMPLFRAAPLDAEPEQLEDSRRRRCWSCRRLSLRGRTRRRSRAARCSRRSTRTRRISPVFPPITGVV